MDPNYINYYNAAFAAITGAAYYFSDKRSVQDKIITKVTAALVIDSVVVPIFSGGRSLHDLVGLNPDTLILEPLETIAATAGNTIVLGKAAYRAVVSRKNKNESS